MKKLFFILVAVLLNIDTYAKHKKKTPAAAPDTTPKPEIPPKVETFVDKALAWVDAHQNIVIVAGGLVVLLIVVRTVKSIKAGLKRRTAAQYEEEIKDAVQYWYQCKFCTLTVRNHKEPSKIGCSKSKEHLWTQMAKVGWTEYMCSKCLTSIKASNIPSDHGCPNSLLHSWKKI